eukprot:8793704-Ditylum_brightwellii.AAC.1
MEEGLWPQLFNNSPELINGKQSCPQGTSSCMRKCGMARSYTPREVHWSAQRCFHGNVGSSRACALPIPQQIHKSWVPACWHNQ